MAACDHPAFGVVLRAVTCVLVLIFFQVGYYWGYRLHDGPGVFDAELALDRWLPLVPEFIVFYMLGYIFVLVPCLAVRRRHDFYAATVCFCLILAVGFLCFRYLPVHMDKPLATGGEWFARWTRFQQAVDTPYNNFPSLHVALNVFAFGLLSWQARKQSWWWLPIPVLIVLSTLLVKQHLVLDVLAGLLLAGLGVFGFRHLQARSPRQVLAAFLVCFSGLLLLLATHLERLAHTWHKISRFVTAGGAAAEVVATGLVVLLVFGWLASRQRIGSQS
ncbi:MAG: phosphatase PAP2 family protein [Gammaproteobacteria bacterium]